MSQVNWYRDRVNVKVDEAEADLVTLLALHIEELAKVNINQAPGASGQGLIDTGFMINSVYTVTPGGDSYDQAWTSGAYTNKAGQEVERNLAQKVQLESGDLAMVAVGADYAIFQEQIHGFLIKAAEAAAQQADFKVEKF